MQQTETAPTPKSTTCTTENTTSSKAIQQKVEKHLQASVASYHPNEAMALIINAKTGAVLSSASVDQQGRRGDSTSAITPYEPGSVMKPLLIAAALDSGVVSVDYSYFDTDSVRVGERVIANASIHNPAERSLQEISSLSLNTGAVQLMKEMGGDPTLINEIGRTKWYQYLTQQYHFGVNESLSYKYAKHGYVPTPNVDNANYVYAQTSFGLGLTTSPLEMTAAYAILVNGGEYVAPYMCSNVKKNAPLRSLSASVSEQMTQMLSRTFADNNGLRLNEGYSVGGKSGTAPIATSNGTYQADVNNGTYIGFVARDEPYVIFVRLTNPKYSGYASRAAMLVWNDIVGMLIEDNLLQ
ncbi:MAG: penicillin-binding transpeptidase domain-containing protein [Candidatus Saccharimonadales bacterium]